MQQLPVCHSILLAESLEAIVVQNYYLNEPIKISYLNIGNNDHYLVESKNDKYVLRIYKYNKHWLQRESDYLFELEWLIFLKNKQVPVSYPIQRKDGSYVAQLNAPEGMRYWALFSLAHGEIAKSHIKHCYKYGEAISKLHITSNDFKSSHQRIQIDQNFLIDLPVERIVNYLGDTRREDISYLQFLAEELNLKITRFINTIKKDEWGVIGGDFHGQNHFIQRNGAITLFDFDLCGYGWRAYDLAVFKGELFGLFNGKKVKNCQALWSAFLDGYNTNRFLSKEELQIITTFAQARQIWLMSLCATAPFLNLDNRYWNLKFSCLKKGIS